MGFMRYDSTLVEFDDRLLAHLHIVIMQRLRRDESFAMSWLNAVSAGDGRDSIWIHPAVPIRFHFNGSRVPAINPAWLDVLGLSAASSTGLIVTDEDGNNARSGGVTTA